MDGVMDGAAGRESVAVTGAPRCGGVGGCQNGGAVDGPPVPPPPSGVVRTARKGWWPGAAVAERRQVKVCG
ncbi:hypothetical protein GCM10028832_15460 [Streptomyces sparsus]